MHTETQYYLSKTQHRLRVLFIAVIALQLLFLAAHEMGVASLSMRLSVHLSILLTAAFGLWMLSHVSLSLRMDQTGVTVCFFPYERRSHRIAWADIQKIGILPQASAPNTAVYGRPERNFSRGFWLTAPERPVLYITLNNGVQLFISTAQPDEWLRFLKHEVLITRKM
jgi:hypothetical protein